MDDVQFLKGKEKTGDEFFHTFNSLLNLEGQVIFTSDRPASELQNIDPRLLTRFQSGLTAVMQKPPLEMRVAILLKKLEGWRSSLPLEIVHHIAEKIDTSVRHLEGALTRIVIHFSLIPDTQMQLSEVDKILNDMFLQDVAGPISIDSIQRQVGQNFDLSVSALISPDRSRRLVFARHIAMYLCTKRTKATLKEIGEAFGGRDHGSVIHARKRITRLLEEKDKEAKSAVDAVCEQLSKAS